MATTKEKIISIISEIREGSAEVRKQIENNNTIPEVKAITRPMVDKFFAAHLGIADKLQSIIDEMDSFCTCGNPSGEGDCHFEGDEKLIYLCADCGKQVAD